MASFSFGFGGDDIEDDGQSNVQTQAAGSTSTDPAATPSTSTAIASAFPVAGKPQLPAASHKLQDMLQKLPSKIAYGMLDMPMKDGTVIRVPRRELWDIKVQVMAEDDELGDGAEGLGDHDVKTGIYEGGFKSWESSVDLVKVLGQEGHLAKVGNSSLCVVEVCRCTPTQGLPYTQPLVTDNRDSLAAALRCHPWPCFPKPLRARRQPRAHRCPLWWQTTTLQYCNSPPCPTSFSLGHWHSVTRARHSRTPSKWRMSWS